MPHVSSVSGAKVPNCPTYLRWILATRYEMFYRSEIALYLGTLKNIDILARVVFELSYGEPDTFLFSYISLANVDINRVWFTSSLSS